MIITTGYDSYAVLQHTQAHLKFPALVVHRTTHSFTRFSKHDIVSQVESTLATACGVESNCIVTKANGSKGKVIKHDFQISFQMSQSRSVPVGDL